jgi:hypothetical protein
LHREAPGPDSRMCRAAPATPTAVDRNPDVLLHSLEAFCNGRVRNAITCAWSNRRSVFVALLPSLLELDAPIVQVPTLTDLDNLPDAQVCEVLGILGSVHRRRHGGSSPVLLGCYQSLTKPLVDTLPAHCAHLSNSSLIQLTVSLSDLCTKSRAPKGSNLESVADATSTCAAQKLLDLVLPELIARLKESVATPKQAVKLTLALGDLPASVTSSAVFGKTCKALTPSVEACAEDLDALSAMKMLISATLQDALMPQSSDVLVAYLRAISAMETADWGPQLSPHTVLKTLRAVHCVKRHSPDLLRLALTLVDTARLRGTLSSILTRALTVCPCQVLESMPFYMFADGNGC